MYNTLVVSKKENASKLVAFFITILLFNFHWI